MDISYIRPDFIQIPYVILEDTRISDTGGKVYGLVYFLSQLSKRRCIASNEYLAKLLWTSPGVISNCLTELEKAGYIKRTFIEDSPKKGRSEIIPLIQYHSPVGDRTIHSRVNDHSLTGEQSNNREHKKRVLSESVDSQGFEITPVKEEPPLKVVKDTTYKKVFSLWENSPKNWLMNKAQIQAAKNLLEEQTLAGIVLALEFADKHSDDPFCPTITSPYDLDAKWGKLLAYKNKRS